MGTISLEGHFISPAFLEGPGKGMKEQAKNTENATARIFEIPGIAITMTAESLLRSFRNAHHDHFGIATLQCPGIYRLKLLNPLI